MINVTLYTKQNCPLCDEAEAALQALKQKWQLTIEKVDIYEDDSLLELYQLRIPVVKVDDKVLVEGIVTIDNLNEAFEQL